MENSISNFLKKSLSLLLIAMILLFTISDQAFALNPKVSIIIPVYSNYENLLINCLNSAKNQTLKDIEIICVDDGSTDGSGKILDEYAKNDPRFKVVHQKNGGTCVARNKGMELAKGKYIQFLDHDDMIAPEMSEKCYNAAEEHNADIVKCSRSFPSSKICFNKRFSPFLCNNYNDLVWNGIYKTKFLKDNNLNFNGLLPRGEDIIFNAMCFEKTCKIFLISSPLYTKHNNKNSVCATSNISQFDINHSNNITFLYKKWKNAGYFNDNNAKTGFLSSLIRMGWPRVYKQPNFRIFVNSIDPELLQDDVINLLPTKERIQLRNIIQAAKSE